jgi:hypothetical protein
VEDADLLGGRYRLEDQLGVGGMSVVYRARDEVLGRPVAVKVLAAAYASDDLSRRRIRAEAQAVARLSHPNITDVYDFGESVDEDGERVPYIVMELLPGLTLAQRLAEGPLRPRAGIRICAEVAAALAAAHAGDLVHRDVKPANVVLTPVGAKVLDFGIAAAVGQPDEIDNSSPVFGTPAYLAPERLTGQEVLAASDVYALGLLLYRVLTDKLPWHVETTTQMLTAHVYVEPSALPIVPGVPPEVGEIYTRCVAKNPADRPSAEEVADVLRRAGGLQKRPADDEPSTADAYQAVRTEPAVGDRAGRRGRRILTVALAALAVAAVCAAVFLFSNALDNTGHTPDAARGPGGVTNADGGSSRTGKNNDPKATTPGTAPTSSAPGTGVNGTTGAPDGGSGTTNGGAGRGATTQPGQTPTNTVPTTTLYSAGGAIVVHCQADKNAVIDDVIENAGYQATERVDGPASKVGAIFKSDTGKVRMKIKCKGNGQPVLIGDNE